MPKKDTEKFAGLRQKAEQVLAESPEKLEKIPTDIRELVHELQVRGVELEMQNQQLRRAQLDLEKSRDSYLELYDFAPVGYLTIDSNGSIVQANLAVCALLRIQRSILSRLPFKNYVERSYWNALENHLRLVAETQSKQTCEVELTTRDQTTVYVQMVTVAVDSPVDDDALWYRATLTDISELKKRDETLYQAYSQLDRRVEERTRELAKMNEQLKRVIRNREQLAETVQQEREVLQTILDNIPVMLCFYDSSVEIKLVNREFERRLGWSLDQLHRLDDPLAMFYPDAQSRKEVWEYMMEASPGWRDFEITSRDGKKLSTSWANVRLSDSSQIGIGIDISERKSAEKAVQTSEEKYRLLIQNLPGVAYRGHKDWSVEFIDEKAEAFTGYTAEEFHSRRKKWSELILEEDLYRAKEATIQALKTDKTFIREYRIRTKDGNIRWVQDRGTIVCDEKGELLYIDGVFFDVTERKILDDKLVDYQQQLRSLASQLVLTEEQQRRRLAEDLHDSIGQSLALSKLRVDSLIHGEEGCQDSPELESLSTSLGDIIDQTQSMIFQLSPPVLYEVGLGAALEYLAEWIEKKYDIRTTVNLEWDSFSLPEDESVLLFRAVQELLTNTVKHGKASNSSIKLMGSDHQVYIEVRDDGLGFDTSKLEADESFNNKFGLFSIRERLQHLGGHLQIESSPGAGTKVNMTVPLQLEKKL